MTDAIITLLFIYYYYYYSVLIILSVGVLSNPHMEEENFNVS